MTKKAAFLDRDGVINRAYVRDGKPYPPNGWHDFEILPGVHEAIEQLVALKYRVIVVTNQPDVRTGKQTKEQVEGFHQYLRDNLPIDEIRTCFHVESDNCDCRKPKTGMLFAAARDHGVDCSKSVMIGDRWRDIGAGNTAGCRCFLIDYGYDEMVNLVGLDYESVTDLREAAEILAKA